MTRFLGQPYFQTIPVPISATDYTTPPAEVAAALHLNMDTARVHARAVAGLDIPDGALYGSIATFARTELLGGSVRAYAQSLVEYEEIFEVRSDTLPNGTLVDVVISPMLAHMGGASTTGLGACCSIRSVYEFHIAANIVPYDSSYIAVLPTGQAGVLGGNGHDMQDIQFAQHFGPYTAQAVVGMNFYLSISLDTESEALATAVNDILGRTHNGQSDATATAALLFATEVVPAAAGLAADAPASGLASGGSQGYLIHSASGLRLPGLEALDPANVQAHLLPLTPVPEPATFLVAMFALGGLCLIRRRPLLLG